MKLLNKLLIPKYINIIISIVFIYILTFHFLLPIKDKLTKQTIGQEIIDFYFDESAKQNVTKDVVNYCSYEESKYDKIWCVHNFVYNHFEYNESFNVILPDKIIKTSGDCKSWTNFYVTTLTLLNITTETISLPNHIYLVAYADDFYCNLDQTQIDCYFQKVEE